jgi:hypothetical protein
VTLTLAELDMTEPGWAEELGLQESGFDAAVALLDKKQRQKRGRPQQADGGKPVYGMPGLRSTDFGG